jgi:hypothetical protein
MVNDLNYLLDNNGITVAENEIVVPDCIDKCQLNFNSKAIFVEVRKGAFNPIGFCK